MLIKQRRKLFQLSVPKSLKIVYQRGKGLSLFANRQFRGGGEDIIFLKGAPVSASSATPEAVQLDEHHFIDTPYLVPEDFINHSCSPNTKLDLARRYFVALRDIAKNEEITFNYLTTEYDMVKPHTDFRCQCGSRQCLGHIRGFRYLTSMQQERLKPFTSPFLRGKMKRK